jgi:signal transduction histidine kinase
MKISIRYKIVGLVGTILILAMVTYVYLATSLFTSDKLASIYDSNASLVGTLGEQVQVHTSTLAEELLYFAAEQSSAKSRAESDDAPARALLSADSDVLSLEIWEKRGTALEQTYRYVDPDRLAAFNLSAQDLDDSRKGHKPDPAAVIGEKIVLENVSLPPDVALLRLSAASSDGQRVVISELRPDRLLRLFSRPGLARVYLVDSRGRVLVHPDARKVLSLADQSAVPVVKDALELGSRGAREFDAPEGAVIGAWSAVGVGRLSVVAEVPRAEAFSATRELVRRSVIFAALVIFVALLASIYLSRRLAAPLGKLEQTMAVISEGHFGTQVEVTSRDEIGALATAFNRMSQELSEREARILEANAQLAQSEKLSALGELSAGIVHEVRNPMAAITGFAELCADSTTLDEAREYGAFILGDAKRATEILQNLLDFARPEAVTFESLDATAVAQGALRLVSHQLKTMEVQIETRFPQALNVSGNSNQLRQVLINLMMNAGHAMNGCPERNLLVSTSLATNGAVQISIRDSGVGMPQEVKEKLFRPFFTTKTKGKGTGLGLSVSRKIVTDHRGEILVESEPGKGTTFIVSLPPAPGGDAG